MKKQIFAAIVAGSALIATLNTALANEKIKVTQAVASFAFLPIDYAKAAGFFQFEGIEVQQIATRGGQI